NFSSRAINQTRMTMSKLRWFAVGALLLGALFGLTRVAFERVQAERLPALQGAAAINHLKQQGQYDALAAAVQAARSSNVNGNAPTGQTHQAKLLAGGTLDARFGYAVALDVDTAVVGADYEDIGANNYQGAAYVFVRSGAVWTLQQKLVLAGG